MYTKGGRDEWAGRGRRRGRRRTGGSQARGPLSKTAGPAQVGSPGPKTVKVTVPVGAGAPVDPVTVAVSAIGVPITAAGVA